MLFGSLRPSHDRDVSTNPDSSSHGCVVWAYLKDCHTSQLRVLVQFALRGLYSFPFPNDPWVVLSTDRIFRVLATASAVNFNFHRSFFRFEEVGIGIPFSVERPLSSKSLLIMSSSFRFNIVGRFFSPNIVNDSEVDAAFYPYFTGSFANSSVTVWPRECHWAVLEGRRC